MAHMVRSQRQRHESSDIVDVDKLVPEVGQMSERGRARERCRAFDEEPNHNSGHRDRPKGYIQHQLRSRSLRSFSIEAVPQPCYERFPIERDVKTDPGRRNQRWQPVKVQPGEAAEAERSRAKDSFANVECEEQKHSAPERQERGSKDDDIDKQFEMVARHALIIGTGAGRRSDQPTSCAPFQTNRSPVNTGHFAASDT